MRPIFQVLGLLTLFNSFECMPSNVLRNETNQSRFPDYFRFGTATAAYQIEGAWNADGKTWSIWDHLVRTYPDAVLNGDNGDVAADSYNKFTRDVEMLRELGVDFYRFSVSWPRILPEAFANYVNPTGIAYYDNLINTLLSYNITPICTIYHWDLPQRIQNLGGWTNPEIINWFGDYSKILFVNFGDRVKTWITINEPKQICNYGYGSERLAPRLNEPGIGEYLCSKNVLLAHARAYHIYTDEFKSTQNGEIGISISGTWGEAAFTSEEDIQAAEEYNQFEFGQYMQPIFGEYGNYPELFISKIEARSIEQGYTRSRLPVLTESEIEYIKGSSDFLGLNHYTSVYVYRDDSLDESSFEIPSYAHDLFVGSVRDDAWPQALSAWLREVPWGLYNMLIFIRDRYNNPIVYITENGVSTEAGLVDDSRIQFYRNYLTSVLDAIQDGSNVMAYSAWSLMDNFEWMSGYSERFGLYEVDFSVEAKTRTPRKSAYVYKEIISSRVIDWTYDPDFQLEDMVIEDEFPEVVDVEVTSDSSIACAKVPYYVYIILIKILRQTF